MLQRKMRVKRGGADVTKVNPKSPDKGPSQQRPRGDGEQATQYVWGAHPLRGRRVPGRYFPIPNQIRTAHPAPTKDFYQPRWHHPSSCSGLELSWDPSFPSPSLSSYLDVL